LPAAGRQPLAQTETVFGRSLSEAEAVLGRPLAQPKVVSALRVPLRGLVQDRGESVRGGVLLAAQVVVAVAAVVRRLEFVAANVLVLKLTTKNTTTLKFKFLQMVDLYLI
jgi:hypothetical protein